MNKYELRGNRVTPMQKEEIIAMAVNFCHEFKINKRKKKRCDKVFEDIEYQSDFVISLLLQTLMIFKGVFCIKTFKPL